MKSCKALRCKELQVFFTKGKQDLTDGTTMIFRGKALPEEDIDTFTQSGIWWVNGPPFPINWHFASAGRIVVFGSPSSNHFTKVQMVINTSGRILIRSRGEGGWQEWRPVLEDTDITEIVPIYNSSKTYKIGDYVLTRNSQNSGYVLYSCIENIEEAETWNLSHWIRVQSSIANNVLIQKGQLTSGTDLNTISTIGDYWFNSNASLVNGPEIPTEHGGRVIVFGSPSSNIYIQKYRCL